MSLLLIQQIIKMLIYLLFGFVLGKAGLINNEQSKGMSVLCLYVISPCAIFISFQRDFSRELIVSMAGAIALYFCLHILFLLIYRILTQRLGFSGVEGVCMIYPNSGNLVIPLVIATLGSEYVIYNAAFMFIYETL